MSGITSVYLAKLLGCQQVLQFIVSNVHGSGVIEMDAQRIQSALISEIEDESEYGRIIEDRRALLWSTSDVSCKWVRRTENKLAHYNCPFCIFVSKFS